METVKIKLVKSLIGSKVGQISTAHSLGLKRIGDEKIQPDNAATRGKIVKIRHLVTVSPESSSEKNSKKNSK